MLTHIVHQSPQLVTFFESLGLSLTEPQKRHLINLADGIDVCICLKHQKGLLRLTAKAYHLVKELFHQKRQRVVSRLSVAVVARSWKLRAERAKPLSGAGFSAHRAWFL